MVEGAVVTWWQGFFSYLQPLLLWHWLTGSRGWFYRFYRNVKSGFDPRFRRRKRLLSWVEQAAGRDVLDLAVVWRDGSILCEVIHRACPAACQGWEESQSKDTFRHAQALVYRCLQLDPAFSEQELCQAELTPNIEKRLFRYVQAIKFAISKRHLTRSVEEESEGEPLIAEEYIARGMGLIMASRRQPAIFYIYSRDGSSLMDIHIEIRGPGDDFGSALVSQVDNNVPGDCSITIEYKVTPEYLRVSYQPRSVGRHELSVSRHGYIVPGSPFVVTVDEITEKQPKKRFNSIEWYTEDEERRQKCLQEKKKSTKVKLRVVDFVTEKMILTEDGKLVKISPNVQTCASPPPPDFPAPRIPQLPNSLEILPSISTSPTRSCESRSSSSRSRRSVSPKLRNKRASNRKRININPDAMKYILVKPQKEEVKRVSDASSQVTLDIHENVFQDKCKRIVNVCNYLLRHCPRQRSLEIISGAGHILQTGMPKKNMGYKIKKEPVSVTEVCDEDDEVFITSPCLSPTVKTIMYPKRCRSISLSFVNDKISDSAGSVAEEVNETHSSNRRGSNDSGHLASAARQSFRCEGNTKSPRRRISFSSITAQNDDSTIQSTDDENSRDIVLVGSNINASGDLNTKKINSSEITPIRYSQIEDEVLEVVPSKEQIKNSLDFNQTSHESEFKTEVSVAENNGVQLPITNCEEEDCIPSNMNYSKNNPATPCLKNELNMYCDQEKHKTSKFVLDSYSLGSPHNDNSKPNQQSKTISKLQIDNKISKRVSSTKGNLVKSIIAHFETNVDSEIEKEKRESVSQKPALLTENKNKTVEQCYIVSGNKSVAVQEKVMQIEDQLQIEYLKSIGAKVECISTVKPKIEMFENGVKKDCVVSSKLPTSKDGLGSPDTILLEPLKNPLLENKARKHTFRAEPAIIVSKHYAELQEYSLHKINTPEAVIFDFKSDTCVGSQNRAQSEELNFGESEVLSRSSCENNQNNPQAPIIVKPLENLAEEIIKADIHFERLHEDAKPFYIDEPQSGEAEIEEHSSSKIDKGDFNVPQSTMKNESITLHEHSNIANDRNKTVKYSLNNEKNGEEAKKYEPTVVALVTEVPKDPDKQTKNFNQTEINENNYSISNNTEQNDDTYKYLREKDHLDDDQFTTKSNKQSELNNLSITSLIEDTRESKSNKIARLSEKEEILSNSIVDYDVETFVDISPKEHITQNQHLRSIEESNEESIKLFFNQPIKMEGINNNTHKKEEVKDITYDLTTNSSTGIISSNNFLGEERDYDYKQNEIDSKEEVNITRLEEQILTDNSVQTDVELKLQNVKEEESILTNQQSLEKKEESVVVGNVEVKKCILKQTTAGGIESKVKDETKSVINSIMKSSSTEIMESNVFSRELTQNSIVNVLEETCKQQLPTESELREEIVKVGVDESTEKIDLDTITSNYIIINKNDTDNSKEFIGSEKSTVFKNDFEQTSSDILVARDIVEKCSKENSIKEVVAGPDALYLTNTETINKLTEKGSEIVRNSMNLVDETREDKKQTNNKTAPCESIYSLPHSTESEGVDISLHEVSIESVAEHAPAKEMVDEVSYFVIPKLSLENILDSTSSSNPLTKDTKTYTDSFIIDNKPDLVHPDYLIEQNTEVLLNKHTELTKETSLENILPFRIVEECMEPNTKETTSNVIIKDNIKSKDEDTLKNNLIQTVVSLDMGPNKIVKLDTETGFSYMPGETFTGTSSINYESRDEIDTVYTSCCTETDSKSIPPIKTINMVTEAITSNFTIKTDGTQATCILKEATGNRTKEVAEFVPSDEFIPGSNENTYSNTTPQTDLIERESFITSIGQQIDLVKIDTNTEQTNLIIYHEKIKERTIPFETKSTRITNSETVILNNVVIEVTDPAMSKNSEQYSSGGETCNSVNTQDEARVVDNVNEQSGNKLCEKAEIAKNALRKEKPASVDKTTSETVEEITNTLMNDLFRVNCSKVTLPNEMIKVDTDINIENSVSKTVLDTEVNAVTVLPEPIQETCSEIVPPSGITEKEEDTVQDKMKVKYNSDDLPKNYESIKEEDNKPNTSELKNDNSSECIHLKLIANEGIEWNTNVSEKICSENVLLKDKLKKETETILYDNILIEKALITDFGSEEKPINDPVKLGTGTAINELIKESISIVTSLNKLIMGPAEKYVEKITTKTVLGSEMNITQMCYKQDKEPASKSENSVAKQDSESAMIIVTEEGGLDTIHLTDIRVEEKDKECSELAIDSHLYVLPRCNKTEEGKQTDTNKLKKTDNGFEAISKRITQENFSTDVLKEDTTPHVPRCGTIDDLTLGTGTVVLLPNFVTKDNHKHVIDKLSKEVEAEAMIFRDSKHTVVSKDPEESATEAVSSSHMFNIALPLVVNTLSKEVDSTTISKNKMLDTVAETGTDKLARKHVSQDILIAYKVQEGTDININASHEEVCSNPISRKEIMRADSTNITTNQLNNIVQEISETVFTKDIEESSLGNISSNNMVIKGGENTVFNFSHEANTETLLEDRLIDIKKATSLTSMLTSEPTSEDIPMNHKVEVSNELGPATIKELVMADSLNAMNSKEIAYEEKDVTVEAEAFSFTNSTQNLEEEINVTESTEKLTSPKEVIKDEDTDVFIKKLNETARVIAKDTLIEDTVETNLEPTQSTNMCIKPVETDIADIRKEKTSEVVHQNKIEDIETTTDNLTNSTSSDNKTLSLMVVEGTEMFIKESLKESCSAVTSINDNVEEITDTLKLTIESTSGLELNKENTDTDLRDDTDPNTHLLDNITVSNEATSLTNILTIEPTFEDVTMNHMVQVTIGSTLNESVMEVSSNTIYLKENTNAEKDVTVKAEALPFINSTQNVEEEKNVFESAEELTPTKKIIEDEDKEIRPEKLNETAIVTVKDTLIKDTVETILQATQPTNVYIKPVETDVADIKEKKTSEVVDRNKIEENETPKTNLTKNTCSKYDTTNHMATEGTEMLIEESLKEPCSKITSKDVDVEENADTYRITTESRSGTEFNFESTSTDESDETDGNIHSLDKITVSDKATSFTNMKTVEPTSEDVSMNHTVRSSKETNLNDLVMDVSSNSIHSREVTNKEKYVTAEAEVFPFINSAHNFEEEEINISESAEELKTPKEFIKDEKKDISIEKLNETARVTTKDTLIEDTVETILEPTESTNVCIKPVETDTADIKEEKTSGVVHQNKIEDTEIPTYNPTKTTSSEYNTTKHMVMESTDMFIEASMKDMCSSILTFNNCHEEENADARKLPTASTSGLEFMIENTATHISDGTDTNILLIDNIAVNNKETSLSNILTIERITGDTPMNHTVQVSKDTTLNDLLMEVSSNTIYSNEIASEDRDVTVEEEALAFINSKKYVGKEEITISASSEELTSPKEIIEDEDRDLSIEKLNETARVTVKDTMIEDTVETILEPTPSTDMHIKPVKNDTADIREEKTSEVVHQNKIDDIETNRDNLSNPNGSKDIPTDHMVMEKTEILIEESLKELCSAVISINDDVEENTNTLKLTTESTSSLEFNLVNTATNISDKTDTNVPLADNITVSNKETSLSKILTIEPISEDIPMNHVVQVSKEITLNDLEMKVSLNPTYLKEIANEDRDVTAEAETFSFINSTQHLEEEKNVFESAEELTPTKEIIEDEDKDISTEKLNVTAIVTVKDTLTEDTVETILQATQPTNVYIKPVETDVADKSEEKTSEVVHRNKNEDNETPTNNLTKNTCSKYDTTNHEATEGTEMLIEESLKESYSIVTSTDDDLEENGDTYRITTESRSGIELNDENTATDGSGETDTNILLINNITVSKKETSLTNILTIEPISEDIPVNDMAQVTINANFNNSVMEVSSNPIYSKEMANEDRDVTVETEAFPFIPIIQNVKEEEISVSVSAEELKSPKEIIKGEDKDLSIERLNETTKVTTKDTFIEDTVETILECTQSTNMCIKPVKNDTADTRDEKTSEVVQQNKIEDIETNRDNLSNSIGSKDIPTNLMVMEKTEILIEESLKELCSAVTINDDLEENADTLRITTESRSGIELNVENTATDGSGETDTNILLINNISLSNKGTSLSKILTIEPISEDIPMNHMVQVNKDIILNDLEMEISLNPTYSKEVANEDRVVTVEAEAFRFIPVIQHVKEDEINVSVSAEELTSPKEIIENEDRDLSIKKLNETARVTSENTSIEDTVETILECPQSTDLRIKPVETDTADIRDEKTSEVVLQNQIEDIETTTDNLTNSAQSKDIPINHMAMEKTEMFIEESLKEPCSKITSINDDVEENTDTLKLSTESTSSLEINVEKTVSGISDKTDTNIFSTDNITVSNKETSLSKILTIKPISKEIPTNHIVQVGKDITFNDLDMEVSLSPIYSKQKTNEDRDVTVEAEAFSFIYSTQNVEEEKSVFESARELTTQQDIIEDEDKDISTEKLNETARVTVTDTLIEDTKETILEPTQSTNMCITPIETDIADIREENTSEVILQNKIEEIETTTDNLTNSTGSKDIPTNHMAMKSTEMFIVESLKESCSTVTSINDYVEVNTDTLKLTTESTSGLKTNFENTADISEETDTNILLTDNITVSNKETSLSKILTTNPISEGIPINHMVQVSKDISLNDLAMEASSNPIYLKEIANEDMDVTVESEAFPSINSKKNVEEEINVSESAEEPTSRKEMKNNEDTDELIEKLHETARVITKGTLIEDTVEPILEPTQSTNMCIAPVETDIADVREKKTSEVVLQNQIEDIETTTCNLTSSVGTRDIPTNHMALERTEMFVEESLKESCSIVTFTNLDVEDNTDTLTITTKSSSGLECDSNLHLKETVPEVSVLNDIAFEDTFVQQAALEIEPEMLKSADILMEDVYTSTDKSFRDVDSKCIPQKTINEYDPKQFLQDCSDCIPTDKSLTIPDLAEEKVLPTEQFISEKISAIEQSGTSNVHNICSADEHYVAESTNQTLDLVGNGVVHTQLSSEGPSVSLESVLSPILGQGLVRQSEDCIVEGNIVECCSEQDEKVSVLSSSSETNFLLKEVSSLDSSSTNVCEKSTIKEGKDVSDQQEFLFCVFNTTQSVTRSPKDLYSEVDDVLEVLVHKEEPLPASCSTEPSLEAISEISPPHPKIDSHKRLEEAVTLTVIETSLTSNNATIASDTSELHITINSLERTDSAPWVYESESSSYQSKQSTINDTFGSSKATDIECNVSKNYNYDKSLYQESILLENNAFPARELYPQLVSNTNIPALKNGSEDNSIHTFNCKPETSSDQSLFSITEHLNSAVKNTLEAPNADTKRIPNKQCSKIATQIKKFIFTDSNEYTINDESFQDDSNDTDQFCFLTSFNALNSEGPAKTFENAVVFSEIPSSPEPDILTSATLNKRQEPFINDLSKVQLMKQRFENSSCSVYTKNMSVEDRNKPKELHMKSSLTTEKNRPRCIDIQLGNNEDDITAFDFCSQYSSVKSIWENKEHVTPAEMNQCNREELCPGQKYIEHFHLRENSFDNNKQHEKAFEDTYVSSEKHTNEGIEKILSIESETLNNNLISVEQELSEVLNIASEEIDSEIQLEIAEIDAMDSLDFSNDTMSCMNISDKESSNKFLDLDENQSDVFHTLPKSKKLIHVDSSLLNMDLSDDEINNFEEEKLDHKLVNVSFLDTSLEEDINFDVGSTQKSPETVCVVKPRLILVNPDFKENSLIDDEELDNDLQKELDDIDNIEQSFSIDESERGSVELSSSAIGFFSNQLDNECEAHNESPIYVLGTEDISNSDSDLQYQRKYQHDMNNYEFFKSSSNCMYSDSCANNFPMHQHGYGSLEPSFDSLQSGLSGAGESFSDKLALFTENNLSMSTESDGSDFNAWSSNVEFGDPTETKDQEGMDFDSIISAPNLSEALKKLEAHIQDKGDEIQWLAVRTPSPSLQSLEKYFKDGVSCFDTEQFYVEVSGGLLPERTDTDSKGSPEKSHYISIKDIQVAHHEELLECSYAPGSMEAKDCETHNQVSESDNWIISPFQYPRVLLANTDQMSIIVEEEDHRKSQPPSPLQKGHQDTLFSSEPSIEESTTGQYSNQTGFQEHVRQESGEINQTLEQFDRLINRPSVDESTLGLPNNDSEESLNEQKVIVGAEKYPSTNSNPAIDYWEDCDEMTCDTITSIVQENMQPKGCKVKKRNIETNSNIDPFSNVHKSDSDYIKNKCIQEGKCYTKQVNNVREEIKFLLEGNIDSISEDKLNNFNVTERTTFWDKKLQKIQELDIQTVPSSGPKSLSNIKSGTVQELVSCFAENHNIIEPSPCMTRTQNNFSKTAGKEKLNEEIVEKEKQEGNNTKLVRSPLKEYIDGGTTSVKPVSQWKAYWDDIITEQHTSNHREINKVHKIPSIKISHNGENDPVAILNEHVQCKNSDVSEAKLSICDYENTLQKDKDTIETVVTSNKSTGSVLRNIKVFSECSTPTASSHITALNEYESRDSCSCFETGKENKVNSRNESINSHLSILEPTFRTRSYSAGHLDTTSIAIASKGNSEKRVQETKSTEDVSIGQQNEFRVRFERAKHFFKQLESLGPGEIKERDYRSMPRLDIVLPKNRKPSIDSDSGTDIKPQKRRDRYRNRRKKRKNSSNIQSAPTSDTETAKRIQSKDSFESFGGSVKIVKVSERFHVKDLFRDVSGKVGLFRGIPNQAAVLASLKSVDDERAFSPYKMDFIDPKSASLGNIPAGFQNEYPYLPTTPANQFRPRSALEFNLIPRSQLLDEDF